jgi:hypothetical protein
MFLYRTSKAMIWGQAYRPKNAAEGKERMNSFVDKYFERIEADVQDGTWLTYKVNWKPSVLPNGKQALETDNVHPDARSDWFPVGHRVPNPC